jgi:hypothetical protein
MSLDQRSYEEKRDFIRVPVDCEVALEAAANGRRFTGIGKNLSASGVLFHTDELLAPGDRLEIHIESSQALLSVLDATIEVIRVEPVAESACYAVGSAIRRIHD